MVEREPPTYTVPPLTDKARTSPPALGSQDVATPVAASTDARRFRGVPPLMAVKSPPANTVPPITPRARTRSFGFGSQSVATPVAASIAASWFLLGPP